MRSRLTSTRIRSYLAQAPVAPRRVHDYVAACTHMNALQTVNRGGIKAKGPSAALQPPQAVVGQAIPVHLVALKIKCTTKI